MLIRRIPAHQIAIDVLIAVLAVALRLAAGRPETGVPVMVAVLLMGVAFALHRVSPGIALAIAWAGAIVQVAAILPPDLANAAILAVLYSTARHGDGVVRWAGLASAGVGAVVVGGYFGAISYVTSQEGGGSVGLTFSSASAAVAFGLIGTGATLGLSWTLGQLMRVAARARESREQQRMAERTAIVEQERSRIARDMHDVVAHSLAVVIAQADGARYARAADPGSVDAALTTISTTAREALADVRLLLGQLRHDSASGPQPVLADLDALVAQVRASGLDVRFDRAGQPATLPASHQLALYRIVQEALTNALRHGDTGAPALVELRSGEHAIELVVANRMRPGAAASGGHGLTGMRERALLIGGTLSAAPEGERFVVRCTVPVRSGVTA